MREAKSNIRYRLCGPRPFGANTAAVLCGLVGILLVTTFGPRPTQTQAVVAPGDGRSLSLGGGFSARGPFGAGWRRVEVERADGETFTALLHYPALEDGADATLDRAGAPYPVIAFGHGFAQTPDRYDGTLRHLASHGYLVVAPESFSGILPAPDHSAFADDLLRSLSWLEEVSAGAPGGPTDLVGVVDVGVYGLSGHSMGGGASLLATARDARIRAVAPLAPAETRPSAVAAMAEVRVPVALIAGSEDAITPLDEHQRPMFVAGLDPRLLLVVRGGSHCGFQDKPFPLACDRGSMAPEDQLALTRWILTAFFELHLRGRDDVWPVVWGTEMLEAPELDVIAEPGLEVWHLPATGDPGSAMLRNTGPEPARFDLSVEPAGTGMRPSVSSTPRLDPGEAFGFGLVNDPELTRPLGGFIRPLLVARSDRHPRVRAYVELPARDPWLVGRAVALPIAERR